MKLKAATQEGAYRVQRSLQVQSQTLYGPKKGVKLQCQSSAQCYCHCVRFHANLPVPNMEKNKVFHNRQAWHCIFGTHNVGTCEVVTYTYHEGEELVERTMSRQCC
jgi:hypothetical protein